MSRRFTQNDTPSKPPTKPNTAGTFKVNGNENSNSLAAFSGNLHQYFNDATLHGLRYIGDRTLTWFERFVRQP